MKTLKSYLLLFLSGIILIACDVKKSNIAPENNFIKVYHNPDYNISFYPLDMLQTDDGGFLILSALEDTTLNSFLPVYLMKTDNLGNFEWETYPDHSNVSPVPKLLYINGNYYFVCMDATTQNTRFVKIDTKTGETSQVSSSALMFPLTAYTDSKDNVIVMNFDRVGRKTILTKYGNNFQQEWSSTFDIIGDVENQIRLHLAKKGKQYPFYIGEIDENGTIGHYYFNGFKNYTMTLVFVGAASGNQTGLLNTFQDEAAISSTVSLDSGNFAISRYYLGDNFIFPKVKIDMGTSQNANNFNDSKLPELTPDASVRTIKNELNQKQVITYASQTRTNQLVLYIFDATDGNLLFTKYLGNDNPVEIVSLIATNEGGLALLARTFVAGRFPRIALYKLSPEQLKF
jgi:hypothetical protein